MDQVALLAALPVPMGPELQLGQYPLGSDRALLSLRSWWTNIALGSLRSSGTGNALSPLWSNRALGTPLSFWTRQAWGSLRTHWATIRSGGSSGTGNALLPRLPRLAWLSIWSRWSSWAWRTTRPLGPETARPWWSSWAWRSRHSWLSLRSWFSPVNLEDL